MIKLTFSVAEKRLLEEQRYHHPHPRVRQRREALWLKSQGLSHRQIAELAGISATTLTHYLRLYQAGGIERLQNVRFHQPVSELHAHRATLEAYFRAHPPASVKEAMAKIEELTGLQRSENRVRVFLNAIGMRCRKVGMIPAKADPEKQETFKKKNLNLVLKKRKRANGRSSLSMRRISC